ncbi:MAG: phosphotransferase system enzyme component [Gemmatimonadetes bacterium]|nr:phosphotransferase system enzyme component [Gemmatimonadota bacterium]
MSEGVTRALVAGHADFGAGLVSAVEAITGQGAMLEPIHVTGLCSEDIQQLLRERVLATGARVIFTDLQAGSCTMAARRVLREVADVVLVSGTNLPMLLDFTLSRATDPVEAARTAVERGRASMTVIGGGE